MSEWFSPTGYNDPDGKWIYEPLAYDEDTDTYALTTILKNSWGPFLELIVPSLSCSKVRFNAWGYEPRFDGIDLDVYYNDAWHHVYQGDFPHRTWVEKSLGGTYVVTRARVRAHNNLPDAGTNWRLYEFDFWGVGVPVFSVALVLAAAAAAVGVVLVIAGR